MGIDMSDYKMVYKDKVYNCKSLVIVKYDEQGAGILEVVYLDDENRVAFLNDDIDKFQFIRR